MMRAIFAYAFLLCPVVALAQMVSGDAIGNDPAREKLCRSRIPASMGKPAPFEIDMRYVERGRKNDPDITFVALDRASLVECYLRQGTGRYEPASYSGENNYWHLKKPEQYSPGVNTDAGRRAAVKICVDAAVQKFAKPSY